VRQTAAQPLGRYARTLTRCELVEGAAPAVRRGGHSRNNGAGRQVFCAPVGLMRENWCSTAPGPQRQASS